MHIKNVMTNHVLTVTPKHTVSDAAEIMKRLDTGFLPVGENDRLVGTVTDRDIVVRGLADGKSADTAIADVMSKNILYCFEDQEVSEVADNMSEQQVRRMPVMNRDKRLVGVVSLGDLWTEGDQADANKTLKGVSE